MEDVAYLEIKQSLKEKFTKNFVEEVDVISKNFASSVTELLGNDYLEYKTEFINLEKFSAKTKEEFFSSSDYVSIKNEVSALKKRIDEEEGDIELDKQLHEKLSKLSTLNTTLNNKLKATRERITHLKFLIKGLFDIHSVEFNALKKSAVSDVTEIINKTVVEFNVELDEVKRNFDVEVGEKEFPFDFDSVDLSGVYGTFETEYIDESVTELNGDNEFSNLNDATAVYSENTSEFTN